MVVLIGKMNTTKQKLAYLRPFLGNEFCADGDLADVETDRAGDPWAVHREAVDDGADADDEVEVDADEKVNEVETDDENDEDMDDEVDEVVDDGWWTSWRWRWWCSRWW